MQCLSITTFCSEKRYTVDSRHHQHHHRVVLSNYFVAEIVRDSWIYKTISSCNGYNIGLAARWPQLQFLSFLLICCDFVV